MTTTLFVFGQLKVISFESTPVTSFFVSLFKRVIPLLFNDNINILSEVFPTLFQIGAIKADMDEDSQWSQGLISAVCCCFGFTRDLSI